MSTIMGVATVSEKGQLVIPRDIRTALDIKKGDRVEWSLTEAGELRVSVAKKDLRVLKGMIPSKGRTVSVEAMDVAIKVGASEQ